MLQVWASGKLRHMKRLSHQLKPLFVDAVMAAFPEVGAEQAMDLVTVEEPREKAHGDFACPVPFKLAKVLGKSPAQIGEKIVENFPEDFKVGGIEFVAPGFINLRLNVRFMEELLTEVEKGVSYEAEQEFNRPIVIDYTSTNAAKQVGAHHMITTFLGDALANLFEFMGRKVERINHLGDWGTNFGQLIYAVETWGNQEEIERDPCRELNKLYVRFHKEAGENPELKDEARKIFKSLEEGDELRKAMWEWIVGESIKDIDKTFARMGVHVKHMGESFYLKRADEVITRGEESGLFVEGEKGSLIFEMGEDQVPALIRKSDGTTLYLTRDLAAAEYRAQTWNPESVLYVVDHAQSLHFKQVFAICEEMKLNESSDLEHISFGRMSFKDRSMSTRKGHTIVLEELLDEAAKKAAKLAANKGSELPRQELADLSELIGVASLKYGILSQDRNKDVIFDWDRIVTLEGNSAPYMLYSYARAHKVLEKAGEVALSGIPQFTEEAELALLRDFVKFPEVLDRALLERKPHMICVYLYELCQAFNRFYGECRVADVEDAHVKRSRAGLVSGFMQVLRAGLGVLGIPVVERM